jgi:hypothetical protein
MHAVCNACGSTIPPEDINVGADTALCRGCGAATAYSALVHAPTAGVLSAPPPGCHVEEVAGAGGAPEGGARWRAVASTRSWLAVPAGLFALVWNGILTVFIVLIAAATRGIALPALAGHAQVGVMAAWTAACLAMGDVEAVIEGPGVRVGTGVGPLRRWHRRPLADVREVRAGRDEPRSFRGAMNMNRTRHLVLAGPRPVRSGYLLSAERRQFLHAALAAELRRRHGG